MGYRERRAHKSQQKQQSLGQSYSGDRRVPIPVPVTMNTRDNPNDIPPNHAALLEDVIPSDGGLKVKERPKPMVPLISSTADFPGPFVSYYGSGSTSAEFWVHAGGDLYNITAQIASDNSASATSDTTFAAGDWIEFNKTIIYVTNTGLQQSSKRWTRASSWVNWSASFSGSTSAGNIYGISKFKNRLFAWEKDDTVFWYGSVDEIIGTLNPFDLGGVITGNIRCFVTLPRDGGAGPDDYAAFISDQGDVAVYAGTDPGDANSWSLVGIYKIGKPTGRDAHITYGQQVVVMCEDDFYFLPEDLQGKKSPSVAAEFRKNDINNRMKATFDSKEGKIIFSDGSVLDPKRNWAYSTITLMSAPPHMVRASDTNIFLTGGSFVSSRPTVGEFKGKSYSLERYNGTGSSSAELMVVKQIFPAGNQNAQRKRRARIRTAPLKTSGRTNISLVNPVFGLKPVFSTSSSAIMQLTYKTAVDYDNYRQPYATASSEYLVTTSAALNSNGEWTPGYGTGDVAQIYIQTISASAELPILLYEINLIASDTGGI